MKTTHSSTRAKRIRRAARMASSVALAISTMACVPNEPWKTDAPSATVAPSDDRTPLASPEPEPEPKAPINEAPLWGDTHLHTSHSFDVFLFGTPTATPDTAYRFAKGEWVTSPTTGEAWQLDRPLDFLVVSDHAESLGTIKSAFTEGTEFWDTESGRAMRTMADPNDREALIGIFEFFVNSGLGIPSENDPGLSSMDWYLDLHGDQKRLGAWMDIIETADRHNQPGEFSAFIGWEWTALPGGANLHRVVFTPAGSDIASQFLPLSGTETPRPEDLWEWLASIEERTGAPFIAIPHNSNVSMGRMFPLEDSFRNPLSERYARRRMQFERVVEVTQIKGDSEAHPALSPNDEFADFETYNAVLYPNGPTPDATRGDYVRSALVRGLEIENQIGVNPYQVGMIGSSDSHTGISAIEETAFAGKGQKDSSPADRSKPTGIGVARGWDMGAAGLVAAWATENTRKSIFEAFMRREVYATTGPRISLRLRAELAAEEAGAPSFFDPDTWSRGVPMGGELRKETGNGTPRLLIAAMKDPSGANLDRVQVVKGWVDDSGKGHERVYDVAWSGDRQLDVDGKLPEVGNTVDLETGAYSNAIGAGQLVTLWSDPEFDPAQPSFYYVRALEIPTPRYSLLDAISLGVDVSETGRPATLQERAYSSPVWYRPAEIPIPYGGTLRQMYLRDE